VSATRQYLRDVPAVLRDIRAEVRNVRSAAAGLLPFVWRSAALREREVAETDMFWLGRQWDQENVSAGTE
jgi:hypothetical protein